jgi:hypothetical protein
MYPPPHTILCTEALKTAIPQGAFQHVNWVEGGGKERGGGKGGGRGGGRGTHSTLQGLEAEGKRDRKFGVWEAVGNGRAREVCEYWWWWDLGGDDVVGGSGYWCCLARERWGRLQAQFVGTLTSGGYQVVCV